MLLHHDTFSLLCVFLKCILMKICIAYRGLSFLDNFKNHHGNCSFSMLDVLDNHFSMIVLPLRSLGHDVVFAIETNDSPIFSRIVSKLEPCVHASTHGKDQMHRAHLLLENLPSDVTHVFLLRCDIRFKCYITDIPIHWDIMNFPWVNFDRKFPRNGDVLFAFPRHLFHHVSQSFKTLHLYFKQRREIPHGHGFYKRFFKSFPYHCMVSDFYNSNTDVTQNPIFELGRSFNKSVPLHPKTHHAIKLISQSRLNT